MQAHFDRFAILLSGICAIHCIALPVVASIIPFLSITMEHGNVLHEFWFHQFILLFILPVSVIALISGYRFHRLLAPMMIASIGLAVLVGIALFAEYFIDHDIVSDGGETIITVVGGIIHALGHLLNVTATRKLNRQCPVKG